MVRTVDYETRRRAILAAAINEYIKDAVPVSSEDIARSFSLSSATIRNIFAELEEAGYLTHPHTSAGRVPTHKGYRYYVDFLLSQIELLDAQKESIVREYKREINRLEDALERTSEVLSISTHYAGIVSFLEWQDRLFYKGVSYILDDPEFQDVQRMRILLRMIEDKQHLLKIINRDIKDKVKVYIGEELECGEMKNCSLVVCSYRVHSQAVGRVAVLGPVRMKYSYIIPALEYVSDTLTNVLGEI
jgi:transcriptional regulator of heat shock response